MRDGLTRLRRPPGPVRTVGRMALSFSHVMKLGTSLFEEGLATEPEWEDNDPAISTGRRVTPLAVVVLLSSCRQIAGFTSLGEQKTTLQAGSSSWR